MEATPFIGANAIDLLNKHIDWISLVLVLLGGIFAKKYLDGWRAVCIGKRTFNIGDTWKTLIIGALFITFYLALMASAGQLHKEDYTKYFISYCVATSLYDVLIKQLMRVINKGGKE